MHKDNTHIWYIILALIVVVSAIGTLAYLYYTTTRNSIAYEPLTTTSAPRATTSATAQPSPSPSGDPATIELTKTDNSDTIESIEKDINNTKLDELDKEMPQIEESLQ